MVVNEAVFHYYSLSKERRKKERGYQTVNLEALSRLHVVFPDHPFWDSEKLSSAMEFLRNNEQELVAGINTKHGDLLQGISIAKIYGEFDQISKEQQKRFITQELSTDIGSVDNVITVDSVDENTQTALVSRLTDLPNVEIR